MESAVMVLSVFLVFAGVVTSENRIPNPLLDMPVGDEVQESRANRWSAPSDSYFRKHLQASRGLVIGQINPSEVEKLRQEFRKNPQEALNKYMPPPITEVQCHVEFQVTKSLPGRCTKLGGHIPACQTEEYVEIDYNECS